MKPRVALCYVRDDKGTGSRSWEVSKWQAQNFDGANARLIAYENAVDLSSVGGIAEARNEVVRRFLAAEPCCDWAWLVDRDMGFAEDALYALLASADPVSRPIVGGLTFAAWATHGDGMGGTRWDPLPVLLQWSDELDGGRGLAPMQLYPVSAVFPVAATGAAFLLVHRSVFERIGEDWFTPTVDPSGRKCGEDISFCIRAGHAGFPIHVNSSVRTSHEKRIALAEMDYWTRYQPPPAGEETAVIVPVLRRPQNAAPFMRSLRASTGLAKVYAVADEDDPETVEAWRQAGAEVIVDSVRTFARKVNLAFRRTTEPWLFITGDDVEFRPGWLDHAQHVGDKFRAQVVGTNDLGNPRVMAGEHATHLLIRRSYVDEVGASFDGPGRVCHEGYRHWGPDTEIVEAAKKRGVWAMALGSLVPHNHPLWTGSTEDDTYRLGMESAQQDMALLQARLQLHLNQPERKPVVWDVFPYWKETWAVEARIALWAQLAPDVDYRPVACVGDRTFRGDPLPENLPPLPDSVRKVTVTLDGPGAWEREDQQRNAVSDLLPEMDPDDLILLVDADEIVDPRRLPDIMQATQSGPVKLAMGLWMCGSRWRNILPWLHPAACRARDLPDNPSRELRLSSRPLVPDAGWHLSYYGTDEDIDAKLRAFSHSECDTPEYRAEMARLREHGDDQRVDDPLVGPLADFLATWEAR